MDKSPSKDKKFRPRKIPRYLPGSAQTAFIKGDLKEYNAHLYKVFTATPKVDANPPIFHYDKYMGSCNLELELASLRRIEKDNKHLLEKINIINRTKGIIDTFNQCANNHSSKWDLKLQQFNRINLENKKLYQELINIKTTYPKSEQDEFFKYMVHKMHYFSKFPFTILDKVTKDQILRACDSISKNLDVLETEKPIRQLCFLEFKIDNGIIIGKVIVELYSDIVPQTVDHFLNLCCGPRKKSLKNRPVSKIIVNKYCFAGDTTNYDGKGVSLERENFFLQHARPGVLSMIPMGENNEVNSQFCITFAAMSELDEKYVVFGKIIKGATVLYKVNDFGTWHGKPITKIIISDSGIYERPKKNSKKLTSKKK